MKKLIKELFRQMILESQSFGFFKDRTGIPDYDAVLFGKQNELPKKYAKWIGEIKWMTKEEYFKECAILHNGNYSSELKTVVPDKVENIEYNMNLGVKYNMPYLNYVDNSQEGRHRVIAASNLGQRLIPVLILDLEEVVSRTTISEMLGIWDDLFMDNGRYYFKVKGNDWDSIIRLLKCIVKNFEPYFLDKLIDMKTHPQSYPNISSIIKHRYDLGKEINFRLGRKNDKILDDWLIDERYINYYGDIEASNGILKLCVVLRALKRNNSVMGNIIVRDKECYLRIPDNIRGDFNSYDTCYDMLQDIGNKYYIEDYGLLSVDYQNSLYEIEVSDVKEILEIINK